MSENLAEMLHLKVHAALDLRNQMNETITSISRFTQRLPHHGLFLSTDVPNQGVSQLPTPTPTEYMGPDTPVSLRGRYNDDNYPTDVEVSPAPTELPPIVVTHPSPSPRILSHPLSSHDASNDAPVEEETVCCWGYVDCEEGTSRHASHNTAGGDDSGRASPLIQLPPIARRGDPSHFHTSDVRSTS